MNIKHSLWIWEGREAVFHVNMNFPNFFSSLFTFFRFPCWGRIIYAWKCPFVDMVWRLPINIYIWRSNHIIQSLLSWSFPSVFYWHLKFANSCSVFIAWFSPRFALMLGFCLDLHWCWVFALICNDGGILPWFATLLGFQLDLHQCWVFALV